MTDYCCVLFPNPTLISAGVAEISRLENHCTQGFQGIRRLPWLIPANFFLFAQPNENKTCQLGVSKVLKGNF